VGIAPKTLLRWLQIPEFQAAFRAAKWATFSQSIGRLHPNGLRSGRSDGPGLLLSRGSFLFCQFKLSLWAVRSSPYIDPDFR
jgi:hypothetical protein